MKVNDMTSVDLTGPVSDEAKLLEILCFLFDLCVNLIVKVTKGETKRAKFLMSQLSVLNSHIHEAPSVRIGIL